MKKARESAFVWMIGLILAVVAVNSFRLLEYLAPGIAAHIALGVTDAGVAFACISSLQLRSRRTALDTGNRGTSNIIRSASLGAALFGLIGLLSVLALNW